MDTEKIVERLKKLDTCAVSDALDQLGLKGVALGLRPLWSCGKIAGKVMTYKLEVDGIKESKRHLGTGAVELAMPGDIIVVDHRGRNDVAGWGGTLSLAAKLKGLGGVIVDGACRDVDESADHAFPVYARTAVPITARGRVVEESFNKPIEVSGVLVRPGDYVIADRSGIVFIPASEANIVLEKAEKIAQKEQEMAKKVLSGVPITEVMGINYETMLKKGDQ